MATPTAVEHKPVGRKQTAMIVVLLSSNVLASLSQSLMNVALDHVATQFSITLSQANWMVLAYTIVTATVITMTATMLKRLGLQKVMALAYIFSFAGSILGFIAWDYPVMIVARIFQAVCTGICFPLINEALLTIAPSGKAGTLLAINSGVIGAGLAFAPPISGLVITYFGLRELFLIPAVMSFVLIIAGRFTLHDLYEREKAHIDLLSVCLSFVGLALIMYGLNEISHQLAMSLFIMLVGVVVIGLFSWRQLHTKEPLLNLAPLRFKVFTVGELLVALAYMVSVYMSLLVPLYLEGAASYTPFLAGCMCVMPILCYAACCFPSGHILEKHGIWPLVTIGFIIVLMGYVGMFITSMAMLIIPVLVCSALAYAGIGIFFPSVKSTNLESLPRDISSYGSSIHSTIVQLGSSISSALFVGIMSDETAQMMSAGMSKSTAYAQGFSHTLLIVIGILVAAALISLVYGYLVKHSKSVQESIDSRTKLDNQ